MQSTEWNKALGIRAFVRKRTAHFTVHGPDGLKLLLSEDEMVNIINDLFIAESLATEKKPEVRTPRIVRVKKIISNLWYEPLNRSDIQDHKPAPAI
jgi:hypothetical protein